MVELFLLRKLILMSIRPSRQVRNKYQQSSYNKLEPLRLLGCVGFFKIIISVLSWQVIAAEGEQKASRALREAAEVIAESPSALQVKSQLIRDTESGKREKII